jgi:uncharacterized protein involved in cysteine biosynthesis
VPILTKFYNSERTNVKATLNIYKQASGLMKVLFLPILTNFTFTIAELWDFFRKKKKAISGDNLSLL